LHRCRLHARMPPATATTLGCRDATGRYRTCHLPGCLSRDTIISSGRAHLFILPPACYSQCLHCHLPWRSAPLHLTCCLMEPLPTVCRLPFSLPPALPFAWSTACCGAARGACRTAWDSCGEYTCRLAACPPAACCSCAGTTAAGPNLPEHLPARGATVFLLGHLGLYRCTLATTARCRRRCPGGAAPGTCIYGYKCPPPATSLGNFLLQEACLLLTVTC